LTIVICLTIEKLNNYKPMSSSKVLNFLVFPNLVFAFFDRKAHH